MLKKIFVSIGILLSSTTYANVQISIIYDLQSEVNKQDEKGRTTLHHIALSLKNDKPNWGSYNYIKKDLQTAKKVAQLLLDGASFIKNNNSYNDLPLNPKQESDRFFIATHLVFYAGRKIEKHLHKYKVITKKSPDILNFYNILQHYATNSDIDLL